MNVKSPFLIFQQFLSPKLCEQIVSSLTHLEPDVNLDGIPIKTVINNESCETVVFQYLEPLIPQIEQYYTGFEYEGTEPMSFEWFPEGSKGDFVCENSQYLRKKWVRTRLRDISAVLFLSEYNDKINFDGEFEVYGGKLEFPQHGFGFNPQRGTLIVYPSDPHFINITTKIQVNDLFQVRVQLAGKKPYLYDSKQFPGNYKEWFKEFA